MSVVTSKDAQDDRLCPLRRSPAGHAHPCLGEECMAWRWSEAGRVAVMEKRDRKGYCGQFGEVVWD